MTRCKDSIKVDQMDLPASYRGFSIRESLIYRSFSEDKTPTPLTPNQFGSFDLCDKTGLLW